jgi:Mor family transcriptional regulator
MRTTTTERNREIFIAFLAGKTMNQLAQNYGLAGVTIAALLNIEKHKLAVSGDEFYCDLRRSLGLQPEVKL